MNSSDGESAVVIPRCRRRSRFSLAAFIDASLGIEEKASTEVKRQLGDMFNLHLRSTHWKMNHLDLLRPC